MRAEACWVILGCGSLDTVNRRRREYSYGVPARMLVLMLIALAYAQWQRGVVRTIGKLSLDEDDTDQSTG